METIKVNYKKPIFISQELEIDSLYEYEDDLKIKVKTGTEKWYWYVKTGDTLTFKRIIYDENNESDSLTENLIIKDISEPSNGLVTITTTQPQRRSIRVSDIKVFTSEETEDGKEKKLVYLAKPSWVMPQDIAGVPFRAFGKNHNGTIIYASSAFAIPLYTGPVGATSADTYETSYIEACDDKIKVLKYSYAPTKILRNALLFGEDLDTEIAEGLFSFEFEYNPFYYRGKMDESGYCKCQLWTNLDPWWTTYDEEMNGIANNGVIKINSGDSRTNLCRNTGYWSISTMFQEDANYVSLGTEDLFSEAYVDRIIENEIPEVIDFERVKYSPVNTYGTPLTSITLDFHFRKRALLDDATRSANTTSTQDNMYQDGWFINDDDALWNGMKKGDSLSSFIANSGSVSDVIGYLNFNDNDIFYRKSKVSKTFVRLSFYTSTDPIEQKLLFYSTSFLDATALYGRYIKQYAYMEAEGLTGTHEDSAVTESTQVVFCRNNSVSGVLSSEIVLTNEYDRDKSSEGFNIYLFSDDVDIKDTDSDGNEKSYRTIYMKVEFNHAGNGKTIPMVPSNKIGGLKTSNFFDSLYIPIQISYLNDKYVYKIDPKYGRTSTDGRNFTLMLFEPKLNRDEETKLS